MGELQQGLLTLAGELHINDAARAAEGHHQMTGRLALQDVAAGVTFELKVPAFAEITRERHKPTAYAFRVGDGLPYVGRVGEVTTLQCHRNGFAALGVLPRDLPRGSANLLGNVDDHFDSSLGWADSRRERLPRAISVPRASSRELQYWRNCYRSARDWEMYLPNPFWLGLSLLVSDCRYLSLLNGLRTICGLAADR